MKHIFFVSSTGSIYRRVLPLIDSKKKEDILVVTPNDNIYKFFTTYTSFPTVQIKTHPNLVTRKTLYKLISNTIRSKLEYRKLFNDIKDANIYFFGTGSTIVLFSYIQKLANHNTIYFYSSEPDKLDKQIKPTIVENWKTQIICDVVKILLGIDVKVRKDCGIYSLCVYKEFFEQNNVIEKYQEFDPSIYKSYMKKLKISKDIKVLVLISDLVGEGRIDENVFRKQSNKLFDILEKMYYEQYVVKPHPNMNHLYGKMIFSPKIDAFIPSQFLMNHPWKAIIADCSASLVFPQEQGLKNVKLIQLIDILKFKDERSKKELKQFLVKWNPDLLFPKTFDELEKML